MLIILFRVQVSEALLFLSGVCIFSGVKVKFIYLFRCKTSLFQLFYNRLSIGSPQIYKGLNLKLHNNNNWTECCLLPSYGKFL